MQIQPNNSKVVGLVKLISESINNKKMYEVLVNVESSEDVPPLPNHTAYAIGKDLTILVSERDYTNLKCGAKLSLNVSEKSGCPIDGRLPICEYIGTNLKKI